MKEITIKRQAILYDNIAELDENEQRLVQEAIYAKKNAYAPYSNFKVGAAILLENYTIVTGNNQENAAYPSGMCAERIAIWKVRSEFPKVRILKIAVVASAGNDEAEKPVSPCGACRQVLLEYEINQKEAFEVLFMGANGTVIKVKSVNDLLPFSFDKSFL